MRLGYPGIAEPELQKVSEIATNTLRVYRDPAGSARILVKSSLVRGTAFVVSFPKHDKASVA